MALVKCKYFTLYNLMYTTLLFIIYNRSEGEMITGIIEMIEELLIRFAVLFLNIKIRKLYITSYVFILRTFNFLKLIHI